MKRFFTFSLISFLFTNALFSAEKTSYTSVDSVRYILSIVLKHTGKDYNYYYYPLIVHLYNEHQPDSLLVYPEKYKKRIEPFLYNRLYLYSQLMDGTNISADCLKFEESGEWNDLYKLLFYALYEGPGWNFPKDYVTRLEQHSHDDPFYGPVQALTNIYFLKQYKYDKLGNAVKKSVAELENKLAKTLYDEFIKDKPWSYRKVYALWAIRINKNHVADDVKVDELTDYFDRKNWMVRFNADYEDNDLMKREGDLTTKLSNLCTLWLFCLNK